MARTIRVPQAKKPVIKQPIPQAKEVVKDPIVAVKETAKVDTTQLKDIKED